jgi:hypothetical protein
MPVAPEFSAQYTNYLITEEASRQMAGGCVNPTNTAIIVAQRGLTSFINATLDQGTLVRDGGQQIQALSSQTAYAASCPWPGNGAFFNPSGTLFVSKETFVVGMTLNQIVQFRPSETTIAKTINMTPLGVTPYIWSIKYIPNGYPGAGNMLVLGSGATANDKVFYQFAFTSDGDGTYNLTHVGSKPFASKGSNFAFVPLGSTLFPDPCILVADTGVSSTDIATFTLDDDGYPEAASYRLFSTSISATNVMQADPVTGDIICGSGVRFSTFRGPFTSPLSPPAFPPPAFTASGGAKVAGSATNSIAPGPYTASGGARVGGGSIVTPEPQAPTIDIDSPASTTDGVSVTTPFTATTYPMGSAPDDLEFSASSDNTTLIPTDSIVFEGSGNDWTITVTPPFGEQGTATITITVTDPVTGLIGTATLVVNVVGTSAAFQLTYRLEFLMGRGGPSDEGVYMQFMSDHEDYMRLIRKESYVYGTSDLADAIFDVPGVVVLELCAYRVYLEKAPLFSWDEIVSPVIEEVRGATEKNGLIPMPSINLSSENDRR